MTPAEQRELLIFLRSRDAINPAYQFHALCLAESIDKSGIPANKVPRTVHERAIVKLKWLGELRSTGIQLNTYLERVDGQRH